MNHIVSTRRAITVAVLAGAILTGCGSSSKNTELADNSVNQVYATSWSEVSIDANLAKTKVTTTGHYETNKNACARPGDGAMTLNEWNDFASTMNAAIAQLDPGNPKTCFPIDYRACMDGTATYTRDDGTKVTLFEPGGGGETCTRIQNRDLAEKLYKAINGLTYAADRAGCTLEYERCTR
jgi:outer membrane murein-binding lipoprotein Lpp